MSRPRLHDRSRRLPAGRSGVLLEITPAKAGWELVRFAVRRLAPGRVWRAALGDEEECCLVLLAGSCRVTVGGLGPVDLGPRADVFGGYPHAVYAPAGSRLEVVAVEPTDIADCRAGRAGPPGRFAPRVVRPEDCGFEIRGGGNATRQIVDILPPSFPAARLMICEVFTPGGNWSSYPPHKHDSERPPVEADLEETYYYRMRDPAGYGLQRLYTADGRLDAVLAVGHGDLVLVREGYHPFVAAHGYDAYYLNVLAGRRRSMAAFDDPRHAALRRAWPPPDPRVPIVPPPPGRCDPPWAQPLEAAARGGGSP